MKKLYLLTTVLLLLSGCEFLEVDKCLDSGGRWNYENGVCEFSESQQPENSAVSDK